MFPQREPNQSFKTLAKKHQLSSVFVETSQLKDRHVSNANSLLTVAL